MRWIAGVVMQFLRWLAARAEYRATPQGQDDQAGTAAAGEYRLSWNVTADAAANGKEFKIEPVKNTTHQDKAAAQRLFGTGGDWSQLTGSCLIAISAGDIIYLQVKNVTDDTDITIKHGNVTVTKL